MDSLMYNLTTTETRVAADRSGMDRSGPDRSGPDRFGARLSRGPSSRPFARDRFTSKRSGERQPNGRDLGSQDNCLLSTGMKPRPPIRARRQTLLHALKGVHRQAAKDYDSGPDGGNSGEGPLPWKGIGCRRCGLLLNSVHDRGRKAGGWQEQVLFEKNPIQFVVCVGCSSGAIHCRSALEVGESAGGRDPGHGRAVPSSYLRAGP